MTTERSILLNTAFKNNYRKLPEAILCFRKNMISYKVVFCFLAEDRIRNHFFFQFDTVRTAIMANKDDRQLPKLK